MIKSLFDGVKNVEVTGEAVYTLNGHKTKLQGCRLHDLSVDRWNNLAERTNTASFIRMVGRAPVDYAEVKAWVKGLVQDVPESKEITKKPSRQRQLHNFSRLTESITNSIITNNKA